MFSKTKHITTLTCILVLTLASKKCFANSLTNPHGFDTYIIVLLAITSFILALYAIKLKLQTKRLQLEKHIVVAKNKFRQSRPQNNIKLTDNIIKKRLEDTISRVTIPSLLYMSRLHKMLMQHGEKIDATTTKETLGTILETCIKLHTNFSNMRTWLKLQSSIDQTATTINLHTLTNDITDEIKNLAVAKHITIQNNIATTLETIQFHDPLRTILHQLLLNALEYSNKGEINIAAIKTGSNILFTISDEGIGMKQELANELATDDLATALPIATTQQYRGLGYVIIHNMLHQIKGSIAIQSWLYKGTTVKLTIPILSA